MANKRSKTYTIMVITDRNGKKPLSLCLSKTVVLLLITISFLLLITASFLLFKSAEAGKKLHYFYALRTDNERLRKENGQLRSICNKIRRIDSVSLYLEKLSALSPKSERKKSFGRTAKAKRAEKAAGDVKKKQNARTVSNKKSIATNFAQNGIKGEAENNGGISIPSLLPVDGWITQQFIADSLHEGGAHPGIDIAAAAGVRIKAPAPGTVMAVETDQYYGNLVVIKHNNNFITRYGHCAKVFVATGEKVERNQTIALVGNTGRSTAPHLHYEVVKNGRNVNPLEYISSSNK